jgi:hypothetical protein
MPAEWLLELDDFTPTGNSLNPPALIAHGTCNTTKCSWALALLDLGVA